MRIAYKVKKDILEVVNEPQILEFDERINWIRSNEIEVENKLKVISLFQEAVD
ncbi:hypothetical protein [Chryseobacterium indoltheticum]|uniref:hypothetical protein n=1 Tax=Chryseobacterium indoltheticum TaxID=254 RepID=UPI003F496FAC